MRPKLSLNNFVVDAFDKLSMNRLKNSLRFVFANAVKQSRRLKLDCFAVLAKTRFFVPRGTKQMTAHHRAIISLSTAFTSPQPLVLVLVQRHPA